MFIFGVFRSVPFGFEPVPSLDENSECPSAKHGKHKEMWLIKVPAEVRRIPENFISQCTIL